MYDTDGIPLGSGGVKKPPCCAAGWFQTVEKPLSLIKMGSQGRSPRQGLGAVAPVI